MEFVFKRQNPSQPTAGLERVTEIEPDLCAVVAQARLSGDVLAVIVEDGDRAAFEDGGAQLGVEGPVIHPAVGRGAIGRRHIGSPIIGGVHIEIETLEERLADAAVDAGGFTDLVLVVRGADGPARADGNLRLLPREIFDGAGIDRVHQRLGAAIRELGEFRTAVDGETDLVSRAPIDATPEFFFGGIGRGFRVTAAGTDAEGQAREDLVIEPVDRGPLAGVLKTGGEREVLVDCQIRGELGVDLVGGSQAGVEIFLGCLGAGLGLR